ncbi:MAG TPA: c-type cytochrome, partial [Isosphaeraceae bacterium]|nr:c-type cytochrome [Isosphaeraceae bacterium]
APVVAGFPALAKAVDTASAGRLLLGELSCSACHKADPDRQGPLDRKPAPVLDEVGSRVKPEYLRAYLAAPHSAKPGSTMPDVLAGMPEADRNEAVEALVHFLASTGSPRQARPDRRTIGQGRTFYHRYGCAACHGGETRKSSAPKPDPDDEFPEESVITRGTPPQIVPLGDLPAKYTVPSLAQFLLDPLKARPAGRMPSLNLSRQESEAIASYLLADLRVDLPKNVNYAYYEGNWEELPDFSKLEPVKTGQASGFDVTVGPRRNGFAIRFETQLDLAGAGKYGFELASDDGSALEIDGKPILLNDGIHPRTAVSNALDLAKGSHQIVVTYFEGGGEEELSLSIEGPRMPRQDLSNLVHLPGEEPVISESNTASTFRLDPEKRDRGQALFGSLGCASCHQMKVGQKTIASSLTARALRDLDPTQGCLAESPGSGVPHYDLSEAQRRAIVEALRAPVEAPSPKLVLAHTLAAFDCVACHRRENLGGVSDLTNPYFETTQKEMGDEGRIPPPLDGVGAKLKPDWLEHILKDGAKDRPYMLTRMPKFGGGNVGYLKAILADLDHVEPAPRPEFAESDRRIKEDGRTIVGKQGFNCVGCHTFRGIESTGVQGIDMTLMTRRVQRDWYYRYVINPQSFRPGTRMPSAWPDGQSTLPSVLDGHADQQIEAVWRFLSDGTDAAIPTGLGREPIPLVASNDEAILYRNFIEGAGPRAIGVGYPEAVNLAFDANSFTVAMVWQGAFMDAARHWTGRGDGFQPPMGRNILHLPEGPSLANLSRLPCPRHVAYSRSSTASMM